MRYKRLFEPRKIGEMVVPNRIVMAPMGPGTMQNPDGGFSQRLRDYYEARARGGVGLIMTGATLMTRVTNCEGRKAGSTLFLDATYVGGASELCDAVHRHGARICVQLTPGEGRLFSYRGEIPVAPSDGLKGVWNPRTLSRAATKEEIERIVRDYGYAARLAKAAGFDAIEIRAYGGYFLDQFMSTLWNQRMDEYGGNLDGRLRLLMQAIESVRRSVGKDFPLIVKFTPAHFLEGGRDLEEGLEIARRLEKAGVDALHVDKGCYEVWFHAIPPVHMPLANQLELVKAVKEVVKIPVIANGNLGIDPEVAERALEAGKTDFIGLGRPLLADPEWPNKVRKGELGNIKPCIGCMWGCLKRIFDGKYVSCAVNPQTGMEREFQIEGAVVRKSVLVVGGGPGGMEAARVAALRGHRVTLCEKNPFLGGALRLASAPSFKKRMGLLTDYYARQLATLGVSVELEREMDVDSIVGAKADAVVVAVGAEPVVPARVPGITGNHVHTAEELLLGKVRAERLGERVVIVGGGEVGCETALHLAEQGGGQSIKIIEMLGQILPEAFISVKLLLERRLEESGIRVLCRTRLVGVDAGRIHVEAEGAEKEIDADSVVLAMGYRSHSALGERLKEKELEVYTVGDCNEPRVIMDAVWEGFHVGRMI